MAEKIIVTFNDEHEPNTTLTANVRKDSPKVRHEYPFTIFTDEFGNEYHVQSSAIRSIRVIK